MVDAPAAVVAYTYRDTRRLGCPEATPREPTTDGGCIRNGTLSDLTQLAPFAGTQTRIAETAHPVTTIPTRASAANAGAAQTDTWHRWGYILRRLSLADAPAPADADAPAPAVASGVRQKLRVDKPALRGETARTVVLKRGQHQKSHISEPIKTVMAFFARKT